ncbi:MAG: DHH family phosphoesterase [Halanaerobiaceae bacterium]
MTSLGEIRDDLLQRNNFVILGHIDPDGDCIGSIVALQLYLQQKGKRAVFVLNEPLSDKYDFLGITPDDYYLFDDFSPAGEFQVPETELTFISLDVADIGRLGDGEKLVRDFCLINIDHHVDNPAYGDLNYINAEVSAVGEIIYNIIKLDKEVKIDRRIGAALAMAIITDTGGFRYQNATGRVFEIMADLSKSGIDLYQINQAIYGNLTFEFVKLKGMVLSTLTLVCEGKIAFLKVEQSMLNKLDTDLSSASGLVNYARDIKGVEVGLAFSEIDKDETRVSFRSKQSCPVNEIAAMFDGGGHPRAAGCTINKPLEQSIKFVIDKVKQYV